MDTLDDFLCEQQSDECVDHWYDDDDFALIENLLSLIFDD